MALQQSSPSWDKTISDLMDSKKMYDIIFHVGEGPALRIFASHKLLLSAVSPTLLRLCRGIPRRGVVAIPRVDPDDFEEIMSHIYGKSVVIHSLQHSWNLLPVAKEYGLKRLVEECKEYIIKSIDANNVCSIFEEAVQQEEGPIILEGLRFMTKNAKHLFKRKGLIGAQQNTMAAIIKQDYINVDCEQQILTAVLEWAEAECTLRKYQDNPNAFRDIVLPLLPYIRFVQIGYHSLIKETKLLSILKKDEIMSIAMNSLCRSSLDLPSWCSTVARNRKIDSGFAEEEWEIPCFCATTEHKLSSCREVATMYRAKTGMFVSKIGFRLCHAIPFSSLSAVISVKTDDVLETTVVENRIVFGLQQPVKLKSPLYIRRNGRFEVSIKVDDYSPTIHCCKVPPFFTHAHFFNDAPFTVALEDSERPDFCFCLFAYFSLT